MECLFRGFDYAITTPDGENHVIARNKETSFLTKHLRAYGGEGVYQDHQVGRLLRRITFSGKGYVDKPANPDSIIFTKDSVANFSKASVVNSFGVLNSSTPKGVQLNENQVEKPVSFLGLIDETLAKAELDNTHVSQDTENNMSVDNTTKILEEQLAEAKATLKAVQEENKTLVASHSKASVDKLEATIADLNAKNELLAKEATDKQTALAAVETEKAALAAKLAEAETAKTAAEAKLAEITVANLKSTRIADLVTAGVSKEVATATVETFGSLNDEQFKAVAELAVKASVKTETAKAGDEGDKKAEDKKDEDESEDKAGEAAASAVDLKAAKADKTPALSTENEADEVETTRASMMEWISNTVINKKNKGEK